MVVIGRIGEMEKKNYDYLCYIVRSYRGNEKGIYVVKDFAPSWELFLDYRKWVSEGIWNKEKFENEYKVRFLKEMEKNTDRFKKLVAVSKEKNIGLACYCKDMNVCHRKLVGEILENLGGEVVYRR